ncbi:hypothetical protein [Desulfovibrio sp.]|nr:hypothetical protein [Desulfovibrio sp.]
MKPELGFCIDLARVFAPLSLASVYVLLQSLEGGWMAIFLREFPHVV